MAMQKGTQTKASEMMDKAITELCANRPMSYNEVASELGVSYKTAWLRMNNLKKNGILVRNDKRGQYETFSTTEQRNIPHIPGPSGTISPMSIIYRIADQGKNYTPRLEQYGKEWPRIFTSIMRTAVVISDEEKFPQERHEKYEAWLQQYREELKLRLAQVNAILQTDKFWTEQGLRDFANDPGWRPKEIIKAFERIIAE